MKSVYEIVKGLIYKLSIGHDTDFEEYVRESFKGHTKAELKKYCIDNNIFLKSRDTTRSDILSRIFGSCNIQLGFRVLSTSDIEGENTKDFYKRIYIREYGNN